MTHFLQTLIFVSLLSIICISNVYSSIVNDSLKCKKEIDSISNQEYYLFVDTMPEYPGGLEKLYEFFNLNFKYPVDIDVSGKVIVEFIVDIDGKMKNFRIIRSLVTEFDNETIKVLKMMPLWKAGKCSGKAVPVRIQMPFKITLY